MARFSVLSVGALRRISILVITALASMVLALGAAGSTANVVDALEPGTGLPISPRTDTPRFIGGTVTDQTVVGNRVIVVGTFEQVRDTDGTLRDQAYFAAYDIDSGALDRSYAPVFDREVQAVEPDGNGGVIVGGKFNSIDGAAQRKLARIDANGDRDQTFRAEAGAKVTALAVRNDRVYVGGPFTSVKSKGVSSTRHTIAAFALSDGSLDTNFDFPIREAAGRGGDLSVKSLAFAGSKLVIAHNGLTVGGESRVGAAIIQTAPVNAPSLLPWRTDFFKTNTTDAGGELAITDMAVSPDGSYFVIVSSGGDRPLQARDAAARFPVAGNAGVEPTWISRHFDSMFGVGISDRAVFVGGHFQFQEAPGSPNPFPGDPNINYGAGAAGQGAAQLGNQVVARQQIGALDPVTGKSLNWNPGADAEIGVESLVVVPRGLLVGQDGDTLGGKDIGRHGFFDITRDTPPANGLSTSITSHFNGEGVDAGSVVLSGRATDDDAGVQRVQLAIFEVNSKQYLQTDGSLGPWVGLNATLDAAGGTDVAWQRSVRIEEPGTYRVQAKTFTTDGRKDRTAAYVDLEVRAAGDERPSISIASTSIDDGRRVTVTGSATDDRGVRTVTVAVRDPETNEYLQADGSLRTQSFSVNAQLAAIDAPATTWSHEFVLPRDGIFRIEVDVIDTAGQDDAKFQYRGVTVAENDLPPQILLDGDSIIEVASNGRLRVDPSISDDRGIELVQVRIRKQLTSEGTRPDNSFGANGTWVTLGVVEGALNATPTYSSPNLPPGMYTLEVRAIDTLQLKTTIRRTLEVGPIGDAAPTTKIDRRTVYESPQLVSITGSATDDGGVVAVDVFVRNRALNRWLAPDGSLSSVPVAHAASVDDPGSDRTTWSFAFDAPTEARYQMYAVAIDTEQQRASTSSKANANYWYTPSDTLPVVGLISPVDGATIQGDRLFLTGRAIDDASVDLVQVRVFRLADRTYLRADGTYGSAQWMNATLSNPNRPGTNWDWSSPSLDDGDYQVRVRTRDDSGRYSSETITVTIAR